MKKNWVQRRLERYYPDILNELKRLIQANFPNKFRFNDNTERVLREGLEEYVHYYLQIKPEFVTMSFEEIDRVLYLNIKPTIQNLGDSEMSHISTNFNLNNSDQTTIITPLIESLAPSKPFNLESYKNRQRQHRNEAGESYNTQMNKAFVLRNIPDIDTKHDLPFVCNKIGRMFRKVNDSCMDNFRISRVITRGKKDYYSKDYLLIKNSGCCGFYDEKFTNKLTNNTFIIGCNYGH